MSLTVAYVALFTGILVWWLIVRRLTVKSWENAGTLEAPDTVGQSETPAARIGLWIFLAVVTSLFGLFITAYYMRMGHGHGAVAPYADWIAVNDPPVLWLNTALLLFGSIAMQWARTAVSTGAKERAKFALSAAGVLTIAFLIGQWSAWVQLESAGFFTPANPAIAFFYVLTALHGLHLICGLYVWGRTVVRMWRPGVELIDVKLSIDLCAVYWHYLLIVWLAVFAILLST